jgi:single-strand DNA-binding protein
MADMDDSGYSQQPAPRSQPRASAPAAQRPAGSGFDDMDDDIPF